MKYIKTIEIENFQSHKDSFIELDPYLNVIVGPSDSGKTSIIRAIKWVLCNEPSGSSFVREGEDLTRVSLVFNDSTRVERERNKTKNIYRIFYPNGRDLELSGFGLSVPKEVEAASGVRKVKLDKDFTKSINIAEQLDGPFLLSEKNSTKAGVIGGLVGVDIIDESVVDVLRDLRNLGLEEKSNQDEIDQLNEKLEEFTDLDNQLKKLERLKENYRDIESKIEKKKLLEKYKKNLEVYGLEELELVKLLKSLEGLDRSKDIERSLSEDIRNYRHYLDLKLKSQRNEANIEEGLMIMYKLKKLSYLKLKEEELDSKIKSLLELRAIEKERQDNDRDRKSLLPIVNSLAKIEALKVMENDLFLLIGRLDYLSSLKLRLDDINKRLDLGQNYSSHFENLNSIDLASIELTMASYEKVYEYKKVLDKLSLDQLEIKDKLEAINRGLKEHLETYSSILNDRKICPYCLSNIDKEQIRKIEENFSMTSK